MNKLSLFLILSVFYFGIGQAQSKLPVGIWRGSLHLASGQELPFNFNIKDTAGRQQMYILNGQEKFRVDDIRIKDDSVFIHMPLFDSEFRLKLQNKTLSGNWIKHLGERDAITPFTADQGITYRFFQNTEKPIYNIAGRWSAIFGTGDQRDTTVGEFRENGHIVTGTFLTTTGDYRYLAGTVSGHKLYLSCFDGGHAFLFTADLADATHLTNGMFYSGYSGKEVWTADKNQNAKLPDPYSLTALKPGYKKISFSFPNAVTQQPVSLSDARFKNKVVIIEMMGSWCPNCMDETAFLVNYYKKYHNRGVEVIGLAYERTKDFAKSQKSILQEKKHFGVPYPILITGVTLNKQETAQSLPMLANFVAFPTTIIIDKKGDVRKIYTGYSGPGTGHYYNEFVTEFQKITEDLLAEK